MEATAAYFHTAGAGETDFFDFLGVDIMPCDMFDVLVGPFKISYVHHTPKDAYIVLHPKIDVKEYF